MCPTPPVSFLHGVADHPGVPEEIKQGIKSQIQRNILTELTSRTASEAKIPSTNNTNFAFSIYSMHQKDPDNLSPGELLQDSSGLKVQGADPARDKCYTALELTWRFFKECFHRNSLDDKGVELVATIHYKQDIGDAKWDTNAKQMFFGDGGIYDQSANDGKRTSHLAPLSIDVVGHELTHGMISYIVPDLDFAQQKPPRLTLTKDSPLPPYLADFRSRMTKSRPNDAEAIAKITPDILELQCNMTRLMEAQTLNEHIADCFGLMIKRYNRDTVSNLKSLQEWDIREGWWSEETMEKNNWKEGYHSNYLRTFKIPHVSAGLSQPDQGPKRWDDNTIFLTTDSHRYCGIGNFAFFLAGSRLGTDIWNNVGMIWYRALTDPEFQKKENQTFHGWRDLTIKHAGPVCGSMGTKIVEEAWREAGL
jgi:Zn-dependent metalloprotease